MDWNEQLLLENIHQSHTEDLLERVTAFRAGMEPTAIKMIERELQWRGVTAVQIHDYAEACRRECVFDENGIAKMCSSCRRPAVRGKSGAGICCSVYCRFSRAGRYCKKHDRAGTSTISARHPHPPA